MSKKHFQKLADALRGVRPLNDQDREDEQIRQQWSDCVQAVAIACQDSNPLFKSERFFTACGGLFE